VLRTAKVYGPNAPFVNQLVRSLLASGPRAVPATVRRQALQWVHREDGARATIAAGAGRATG
jgi:nucleoside-diphosphate-sugar epimerase